MAPGQINAAGAATPNFIQPVATQGGGQTTAALAQVQISASDAIIELDMIRNDLEIEIRCPAAQEGIGGTHAYRFGLSAGVQAGEITAQRVFGQRGGSSEAPTVPAYRQFVTQVVAGEVAGLCGHHVSAQLVAEIPGAVADQADAYAFFSGRRAAVVADIQPPDHRSLHRLGQNNVGAAGHLSGLKIEHGTSTGQFIDEQYLALDICHGNRLAFGYAVEVLEYHIGIDPAFPFETGFTQLAFGDQYLDVAVPDFLWRQVCLSQEVARFLVARFDGFYRLHEFAEIKRALCPLG